jgi:C2 domain in Dock180 and Zizimin proteins
LDDGLNVIRKLEFPYVPAPNEIRSDFYVNILNGEFDKGTKVAEKNVEVRAVVYSKDYNKLGDMIMTGTGTGCRANEYRSLIYYHQGKPEWNEWFKVRSIWLDCVILYL